MTTTSKGQKKGQNVFAILVMLAFALQACTLAENTPVAVKDLKTTSGEIPTWTPRPQDLTALPTATKLAPLIQTQTAAPNLTETPAPVPTLKTVTFEISGGNLNVRRGPGLVYNYVGVLYDGDVARAVGRDRISRWLLISLPGNPDARGWVTTETQYSTVKGDVSMLPFVQVEPALPAIIRNCTEHTVRILPDNVELLSKFYPPFNEELFGVGTYQVYDIEMPGDVRLDDISLSEGWTVDIIVDGAEVQSRCPK